MDLNAHMDANGIVSNAVFTILALATVPFAQRSGLGTTSIVQVCTFLLSRGFAPATTHLMLINGSKDHFFYEKMGFTRGGTFDYDGRSVQFEGRAEFQDKAHFATIAQILETVEREHARRLATAATFIKPNDFNFRRREAAAIQLGESSGADRTARLVGSNLYFAARLLVDDARRGLQQPAMAPGCVVA